jgi:hypothetical protein
MHTAEEQTQHYRSFSSPKAFGACEQLCYLIKHFLALGTLNDQLAKEFGFSLWH